VTGPTTVPPFERDIPAMRRERTRMYVALAVLFTIGVAASVVEYSHVPPWLAFTAAMVRLAVSPLAILAALIAARAGGWLAGVVQCNTWWKEATRCR
jgi:hypothetical protein